MAFCSNCGAQLQDGARFCGKCGKGIEKVARRNIVYEGELHQCPRCGESINAFSNACPSCGHEFRDAEVAKSIKEFVEKLEAANTIELQVSLILHYPIPNTKEDVTEFMILACSRISNSVPERLLEAWKAKIEQCYRKARLVFRNEKEFAEIQMLYKKAVQKMGNVQIAKTTKQAGAAASTALSTFWKVMPNPVFGFVSILLVVFEIIRLFSGDFAGIDIVFCGLILWAAYRITEKKTVKNAEVSSRVECPPKNNKIKIPKAITNGTVENYSAAEMLFRQAGFTNIKTVPMNDLTVGFFKKPGTVDEIIINGKKLSSYYRSRFDAEASIVIMYHSLR